MADVISNAETIRSFLVPCPAANAPWQLPSFIIPDGMALVIKANPANGGVVSVAPNSADVINPNQSYPLLPNEPIGYYVKDSKSIWVSSTVAGDSVVCTVEQRSVI